jgi:DNA adenine methylase
MTSYHGGKQRTGKRLAEIIVNESLSIAEAKGWTIKGYCEPFCGMLGVYQHIPELYKEKGCKLKYKGGDLNKSVIMMWNALKRGWTPSTKLITVEQFIKLKTDGASSARKGFVGHFYGYMAKYFQPFRRREKSTLINTIDRLARIGKKIKQEDVTFKSSPYTQYSSLKNYVIYCDPPYQIQAQYYNERSEKLDFNHEQFWKWCRKMAAHNIVFVSEYKAPRDFEEIFSIQSLTTRGVKTERLFVV